MTSDDPVKTLKSFIAEDPDSRYIFDGQRNEPQTEICREGKKLSRKCIQLHMFSTQMFQTMQDQGFFCALPMDPARTHMECFRIPK
ncbi:hypothetical protein QCA50_002886 [Cerrena zonata]|uniref:Uncharacterized protein n=1 Tax=Cerrena zonata TaxID=2478898 RepID=A0AAW0GQH0_9APHY